jgi:hypothetical protein
MRSFLGLCARFIILNLFKERLNADAQPVILLVEFQNSFARRSSGLASVQFQDYQQSHNFHTLRQLKIKFRLKSGRFLLQNKSFPPSHQPILAQADLFGYKKPKPFLPFFLN